MQTDKIIPFILLISFFVNCQSVFADNNNQSEEDSVLNLNKSIDEDLEGLNAMHDITIHSSRDHIEKFSAATIDNYEENLNQSPQ